MLYSVSEPIQYTDPNETLACMTDRDADRLARMYGYMGVEDLSATLPDKAKVIDLGAGLSDLGHAVSHHRPDVNWINFDARYGNTSFPTEEQTAIAQMQATAPPNLTYVGGNVLNLPDEIRAKRFARVFSYYMFPHVIDYFGKETAAKAMRDAVNVIAIGGALSVGPNRYTDYGWSVNITDNTDTETLAEVMVERFTEPYEASRARSDS